MIAISMNAQPHLHPSDSDKSDRVSPPSQTSVALASGLAGPQQSSASVNMFTVPNPPTSSTVSIRDSKVNKRPKLSLQTTSLPVTFGKSTTGLSLSLSTNCTSSPTVRNTFSNAYDVFRGASSPASAATASPTRYTTRSSRRGSPYVGGRHHKDDTPYQLPLGVRGILRNSPIPASSLRRPSSSNAATNSPGAGHNGRRMLFPAKKHVNYRFPLDEEIKTVRFVAKHSDISSSESPSGPSDSYTSEDEESDSSGSLTESGPSEEESTTTSNTAASAQPPRRTKRKMPRSERQIRAAAIRDGLPDHAYDCQTPQTPMQRRRKRLRKWQWTLGPVEHGKVLTSNTSNPSSASAGVNDDRPLSQCEHVTPATPSISVPLLRHPAQHRWSPVVITPNIRDDVADNSRDAINAPLPESLGSIPGASSSASNAGR
jgi:hypothetical protein